MTISKPTFSISDLSAEFDITTRSIRFYEDQGLLHPERKGQTRIYHPQDRVRLKLILRGKRLGFSLAESRELFDLWDETPSGSERQLVKMLENLQSKKAQLEQQLEDLKMTQIEIENAEQRCQSALDDLKLSELNNAESDTTALDAT